MKTKENLPVIRSGESSTAFSATELASAIEKTMYELKKVIVGQDYLLERLLVACLARGHVLVEGLPGLAKTLSLKTLAQVLSVDFRRIQFTPDLLPADLIGTRIYNPANGSFGTELGPVFANFVLADEINRAPAKVQSALLEAMEERQVTIGRETYLLPDAFLVMATQNPLEQEGTYPLPEAQLDRFLFKLLVGYPDQREELTILNRALEAQRARVRAILSAADLERLVGAVGSVYLDPGLGSFIVDIVQKTRDVGNEFVVCGASPRGTLALAKAAQAYALIRGRMYVKPEDVIALAKDCLRHRVLLSYKAVAEGVSADTVLDTVLREVPIPEILVEERYKAHIQKAA